MRWTLPRRPAVWLAVVVAAAALPYANALPASFAFDDVQVLITNPFRTPGMSILDWFARPTILGSVYRPLAMVTYELNARVSPEPWSFHLGNVLLHVGATCAAFDLARLLLRSVVGAGLCALVFAVHPIHTEAVTNVAGRPELLAALGVLVCLSAWIRAERGARPATWTAVSAIALAAALLSKESAYAAALLLPLVALWIRPADRRAAILRLVPHAIVVVAGLALRRAILGALGEATPPPFVDNPLAYVPTSERLATAAVVLVHYLGSLALPLRLSADESFDQVPVVVSALDPRLLTALAMLGLLGTAAWALRRRAPVVGLGVAFFASALVVTSNVVIAIGTCKAERLLYLPSFGWCLAVGWGLRHAIRARARALPVAGVAVLLLALAARTVVRNQDWRDNYTLFTRTVVASPASVRANANAAAMYGSTGRLDLAREYYERAVAIRADFVPAVVGLAQVAELRGDLDRALAGYLEAIRLEPRDRRAVLRAADLLARRGDVERAAAILRDATARAPEDRELAAALARVDHPS